MLATLGFIIGYGPNVAFYVSGITGAVQESYSSLLLPVLEFNFFCSLCLNPVLYAFRSESFQQGFKRIIFCGDPKPENEMQATATTIQVT